MKISDKFKNFLKKHGAIIEILLAIFVIGVSIRGCSVANEANDISRKISDVTNRPYILFENVNWQYDEATHEENSKKLKVTYEFKLSNNGTLPAWVVGYKIYVSGGKEVIPLVIAPKDKPTENFTIGKGNQENRAGYFSLMQNDNEENGPVDRFNAVEHKMAFLIVKYKTLGQSYSNETFTYWELSLLRGKTSSEKLECGTNAMTPEEINTLFANQNKRLSENNAQ